MHSRCLFTGILLLICGAAHAQIQNGDFEALGSNWTISAPPGWNITFPLAGGNPGGYARIESPASHPGGIACISQTFECGPADTTGICNIYFDWGFHFIAGNPDAGRLTVMIDSDQYMQVTYFPLAEEWRGPEGGFGVWCGTHTVSLCLEVDPGSNHFALGYDNVRSESECATVGAERARWDVVKSLFR